MKTIYKYPIEITDSQVIKLPKEYRVLTVQMQNNNPFLWALVDTDNDLEDAEILIIGTGHGIQNIETMEYISTIQVNNGKLIFHVGSLYKIKGSNLTVTTPQCLTNIIFIQMATDIINKYISETYGRFLDNCIFLCSKVYFMHGLEYDLLNDSLADFLDRIERDDNFREKVEGMLSRKNKNNEFSELDNYILSIIKMNVYSKTARFRQKYGLEVQEPGTYIDVDFQRLNIIDDRDENIELEQDIQEKERQFKEACNIYGLSSKARDIFRWKLIDGNPLCDYPSDGNKRKVYDIYNKTLQLVKDKIAGSLLL